ncbi:MAG TPA: histidine kinase, partial [Negativicutes bacterium]|nr:histidine kinase [Negativicutes bacterium]
RQDHHTPGSKSGIITTSTLQVLASGQYMVVQEKAGIGCANPNCLLASKVVVPITSRGEVVGALVLYKAAENGISPFEVELAIGLGQLVSTQIEVSRGELEAELRARAEIKALQAQINPHFLFNAINTIVYYCRKRPETARELLLHLGEFYRNNISGLEELVDLQTEIRHVDSYVRIEMARFHGKLKVVYDIPPDCNCLLPPLILQPLVENAIRHGIYPRKQGGTVKVSARMAVDNVLITVEDDGVGMDSGVVSRVLENDPTRKSIGLGNVNSRLRILYGDGAGLRIESAPDLGTRVTITIPGERSDKDAAQSVNS